MSFWSKLFGESQDVSGDSVAPALDENVPRDQWGRTPLMNALRRHDDTWREVGLEAGINLQDNDGKTALMYAVRYVPHSSALELIWHALKAGANVNLQNRSGETALMYAAYIDYSLVDLLVHNSADVNIGDTNGRTALMSAAAASDKGATAGVLVEAGASINLQNKNGDSALIVAAIFGNADIVAGLAELGGDVDLQDKNGRTALMHAAEKGHAEVVAALLDAGANVNVEDADGRTAFSCAEEKGHSEIVLLLEGRNSEPGLTDQAPFAEETKAVETTDSYSLPSAAALFGVLPTINESHLAEDFELDYTAGAYGPGEQRHWDALAIARRGQREQAIAAWQEAIETGLDGALRATAYGNCAQLHMELGDVPAAVDAFLACLATAPRPPDAAWDAAKRLSYVYEAAGREADAMALDRFAEIATARSAIAAQHMTEEIQKYGLLVREYAEKLEGGARPPQHWS